ncbi:GspH/FimT family pseudopilin [Aestuariirhabdus litorea]|uniref:Type II secretion system protein H n=1 Tax=Aestuariirhabdus litorea TaxID=2528527 RepID=A0A3P3VR01_9GAMM|nr:GspH/FimT family pseudopilin [Aestuariirhabdus litorea]RRJ83253.1 prepilin-type N-terminal cleavage/methylation domain-containing protein [Aestuariirhabdus litorea]RWW93412.1 prepilin-type N-terminal cleavage/methylation domain-containing protein [Endozoicomonadaceae bacterium GTF-13]
MRSSYQSSVRSRQWGFNLVEVTVAVAILGILVALAGPSLATFIADQRIKAATREIVRNIQYARSEAVSRNTVVNLARSSSTARLWEEGWTIYTDADRAGNTPIAAGDTLLRTVNAQPDSITLRADATANGWLSFSPDGTLNEGGATAQFVVCDNRGAISGRSVTINTVGRAQIATAFPATCNP